MVNTDESKVKFPIERRAEYKLYFQWEGVVTLGGYDLGGYVRGGMSEHRVSHNRWRVFETANPKMTSTMTKIQTRTPSSWVVCVTIDWWQLGHVVWMGSGGNMDTAPVIGTVGFTTTVVPGCAWYDATPASPARTHARTHAWVSEWVIA